MLHQRIAIIKLSFTFHSLFVFVNRPFSWLFNSKFVDFGIYVFYRYISIFDYFIFGCVRASMNVCYTVCTRVSACVCYLVILIILKSHSQQIRSEIQNKRTHSAREEKRNGSATTSDNNNRSPSISWPCSNVHCCTFYVCVCVCVWWFAMNWTWYRQTPIAYFTFSRSRSLNCRISHCFVRDARAYGFVGIVVVFSPK